MMSGYEKHANAVMEKYGVHVEFEFNGLSDRFDAGFLTNEYTYTLTSDRGETRGLFNVNKIDTACGRRPTAYDLLATMNKTPCNTLEEARDEFGYDLSRETFQALNDEYFGLIEVFGEDALNDLYEIY